MQLDIKELAKTVAESLNLKDFKGDVVAVKVVENEIDTIEEGGIGIQNVYHGVTSQEKDESAGVTMRSCNSSHRCSLAITLRLLTSCNA